MKLKSSQEINVKYGNLIASLVNNAISLTNGCSKESGVVKYKFGLSTLKDRNVHVYFNNDYVDIDVYLNVDYGQSIPELVCLLQEKIKHDVEKSTRFTVMTVNCHIENFNFV